jgi:hypothetical protein
MNIEISLIKGRITSTSIQTANFILQFLKKLSNIESIDLYLLYSEITKHPEYRLQAANVMSFIEHFTFKRLMKLSESDRYSREVQIFMIEVKYDYVKLCDAVNVYCSEKDITDETEKQRILNEFSTHEHDRLKALNRSIAGNIRTASDRLKDLKILLENHYLNIFLLKEKVISNKEFLEKLRLKKKRELKILNNMKALITVSPKKSEINFLEKEIERLENILSKQSSDNFTSANLLSSMVAKELRDKILEYQSRLTMQLETISAQDLQELREFEQNILIQENIVSDLESKYKEHSHVNSKMSLENSSFSGSKNEINQLMKLISMYSSAFFKNPHLEKMKIVDVIRELKGKSNPHVAPEPTVCTHSCSVEDLTEAIMWLSSGLGGMFKNLDPSLFIFLLTSTFVSHKCGLFDVSNRLFNEVIKSKVLKSKRVGLQDDCEAQVCHDRTGCLSCLGAKTIISFMKYGPNCITGRDNPASFFNKTGLHCLVNDGAIKSLLVSMSTLDSYSLFCFILYLCQQMDYFYSNIARDRKVQIDDKKIADVKFLIALLIEHHLPTNPCLSVLVERYKIPTIVENPIPLAEIASFLSARLGTTIEDASERIMAINREYFSSEKVAIRLKSTEGRLTSWCHADSRHASRHGHGLQEPCPPGCWCCG